MRQFPSYKVAAGFLTISVVLFLLSCSTGKKQEAIAMKDLVPAEMNGWSLQEPVETYDRETIFDYIDGAGEVYLMYGFRKVNVFRYVKPDAPGLTVELFDMGTSEDAFGIFSHARESETSGIGQGYEYKNGLLCFWKSRFFVCIQADEETPDTKEAAFGIARAVDKQITTAGEKPKLLTLLPQEDLDFGSIRFFHTYTALNFHYFLSTENILNLSRKTNAVLAQYQPDETYLLCVEYPSASDAGRGYDGFIENYAPQAKTTGTVKIESCGWVAVKLARQYLVIVLEAPSEQEARRLVDACAENLR
jgi:hypothetical protein